MTPEEYIKTYPDAMKALCEKRAAVMPLIPDKIVHGMNEGFYSGPREEVIIRVASRLSARLDRD